MRTLIYFAQGRIFGAPVREHWLYSSVTDAALHRLAERHKGATSGDESAFLPR